MKTNQAYSATLATVDTLAASLWADHVAAPGKTKADKIAAVLTTLFAAIFAGEVASDGSKTGIKWKILADAAENATFEWADFYAACKVAYQSASAGLALPAWNGGLVGGYRWGAKAKGARGNGKTVKGANSAKLVKSITGMDFAGLNSKAMAEVKAAFILKALELGLKVSA